MTQKQKEYIENNIELIENNEWKKFFESAPKGTGALIYEAGFNFLIFLDSIPRYCFFRSDIQKIVIPDNIKTLDDSSFAYCSNLKSVDIGNNVTSISHDAFYGCDSLTSIVIPNSVTSIGYYAFSRCSRLTSVEIPHSVTSINDWAFQVCDDIDNINYNGTKSEWKNLIGNNDRVFKYTKYTCTCSDGIVKN